LPILQQLYQIKVLARIQVKCLVVGQYNRMLHVSDNTYSNAWSSDYITECFTFLAIPIQTNLTDYKYQNNKPKELEGSSYLKG